VTANFVSDVRIQLAGSVTWQRAGPDLFIYGDEILTLRDAAPELDAMMSELETGTSWAAARSTGGAAADETLRLLERLHYIVPKLTERWQGTRLDRQVTWLSAIGFDAEDAQERLCAARVALLGLGGIGSVVLQHLIGAGVERYVLIDADRVETSNLNRQPIYTPAQIGALKVKAAAEYVARHAPEAEVTVHPCEITAAKTLDALMAASPGPWDCLVAAADRPTDFLGRIIAPFCAHTGVPALSGSCGLRTARWGPLITGDRLLGGYRAQEACPPPAPRAMAASFGPTNAIVANFVAKDVITLLAGGVPDCADSVMVVDFMRPGIRAVKLSVPGDVK
jgi:hypothetical protein